MASEYNEEFFRALREGALRSAEEIVPLVLDLIQPRSVIDIGCGTGTWLAVFVRHRITDYLGVDAFTPAGLLEIPLDRFVEADLTQPLALGRSFDLAVSLEVAEHLPDSAAKTFIDSLTGLAPAVLFSAAIPGQGGTGHLNEQWLEYWSRLFADNGFGPIDAVRPRIWNNQRVEVWYAQNIILYVARFRPTEFQRLQPAVTISGVPLAAVHPRLFAERDHQLKETLRAHAVVAADAGRWQAEAAAQSERADRLWQEAERRNAELNLYRYKSEPKNMRLGAFLRAFPQVVAGALRRITRRG
jgi:SAM-dependent methyltransferase